MPRAPRAPAVRKPAPWVGRRPVVVALDGPLVGRWYFEKGPGSWAAMVDAAHHTQPARDAAGRGRPVVLDYVLTDRDVPHPTEPTTGRGLKHTRSGPVD